MDFSYKLGKIVYPYFQFIFDDKRYIDIDLVRDYPNYKTIQNNIHHDTLYFTVIDDYNLTNKKEKGDIKEIQYKDIRHFNPKPTIVNYKNVTYILSTQTEYDKYLYKVDKNNDNAKLYKYIYDIIKKDFEYKQKKHQETTFYIIIL